MYHFTPVSGLVGGILIGIAADVLLLFCANVLGASGICTSILIDPMNSFLEASKHWKLVFLASFMLVAHVLGGIASVDSIYTDTSRPISIVGHLLAGFAVGLGTKLGNGCTSGHGICGLARLSRRSMAAVGVFMVTGISTAIWTSPDMPWAVVTSFLRADEASGRISSGGLYLVLVSVALALVAPFAVKTRSSDDLAQLGPSAIAGSIFALGLFISGMVYPEKVFNFLDLSRLGSGLWDPTLMFVLGGGLATSLIGYQFVEGYGFVNLGDRTLKQPICVSSPSGFGNLPTNSIIDSKLLLGAACFGLGWGIGGICPGKHSGGLSESTTS